MDTPLITITETRIGNFATQSRVFAESDLTVFAFNHRRAPDGAIKAYGMITVAGMEPVMPPGRTPSQWAAPVNSFEVKLSSAFVVKNGPNLDTRTEKAAREAFGEFPTGRDTPFTELKLTDTAKCAILFQISERIKKQVAEFNDEAKRRLMQSLEHAADNFSDDTFAGEKHEIEGFREQVKHWQDKIKALKDRMHKDALALYVEYAKEVGVTGIITEAEILAAKRASNPFHF
jgi:hypothetical protein